MTRRLRLDPAIFHLPVDKMRAGYYSDKYFVRTRDILLANGNRPRVTMQVFGKSRAFLGGIDVLHRRQPFHQHRAVRFGPFEAGKRVGAVGIDARAPQQVGVL